MAPSTSLDRNMACCSNGSKICSLTRTECLASTKLTSGSQNSLSSCDMLMARADVCRAANNTNTHTTSVMHSLNSAMGRDGRVGTFSGRIRGRNCLLYFRFFRRSLNIGKKNWHKIMTMMKLSFDSSETEPLSYARLQVTLGWFAHA